MRIASRINATGLEEFREHTFEHPFMLMTFQFLVQALCLPLWYFVTGGQTRGRNQNDDDNNDNNDNQQNPDPNRYDEPMINAAAPNIQEPPVGPDPAGNDDDQLINPNGDEEPAQPVRPRREPIIPNNPAWNQRPIDNTKFNRFLFLAPAMFDVVRYGLLYLAIRLTYNSRFMMLRSAAVIFTVMLRVAFLSKHMAKYMWVSVSMVVAGLGLIGMTDYVATTSVLSGHIWSRFSVLDRKLSKIPVGMIMVVIGHL
nr:hypothetical protein BaRGS_016459 [Batillaria attramentaria]